MSEREEELALSVEPFIIKLELWLMPVLFTIVLNCRIGRTTFTVLREEEGSVCI